MFDELGSILRGVFLIKDVTPKTEDAILSYGERCSSRIMQQFIDGSTLYDSRQFIITDSSWASLFASASPLNHNSRA